jgi:hypothetical protein
LQTFHVTKESVLSGAETAGDASPTRSAAVRARAAIATADVLRTYATRLM